MTTKPSKNYSSVDDDDKADEEDADLWLTSGERENFQGVLQPIFFLNQFAETCNKQKHWEALLGFPCTVDNKLWDGPSVSSYLDFDMEYQS